MLRRFVVGAVLALASLNISTSAIAQRPACGPRSVLIDALTKRYGESLRLIARENRGFVIEFYAGPKGTWTLVFSRADGRACAVAAGQKHAFVSDGDKSAPGKTPAPGAVPAPTPSQPDKQF